MQEYIIQIIKHLENKGYKKLNPNSNNVYGRTVENTVYVIVVGSCRGLTVEKLKGFNNKVIFDIANNTAMKVELLNILITPDGMFDDIVMDIVENVENVWLFSEDYGKLYVFENQPDDFDGLYYLIDKNTNIEKKKNRVHIRKLFGVVTPILVLANIVIYILSSLTMNPYGTSSVVRALADNLDAVFNHHQYYRIFTAMFVHFSITHIVSNMTILIALGARIENLVGRLKMLFAYVFTGMVASAASLISCYMGHTYRYAGGASGAICGLMGVMIILAILNRGRVSDISLWNLLVLSALTIVNGYVSEGIDNVAHIAGLIAGIMVGIVIGVRNQKVVNRRKM